MCLAVPGQVIELNGQNALVNILGNRTEANISLIADVKIGDYIMVHAGYAIQKYEENEAKENLALIQSLIQKTEHDTTG